MSALSASPDLLRRVGSVKYTGWLAMFLAVFGLWIVLPPVELRSAVWPFVLCGIAAALGLWVVREGERRLGWTAVGVAILCVVLGYGATRSSVGKLDGAHLTEAGPGLVDWGQMIYLMFIFGAPLAYVALGGMFSERSGVVNVGLDGMMLAGCFFGILAADKTDSWPVGLVAAAAAGALLALIHAFLSIHMRADQIVGGTAINFLAYGVTGYFFIQVYGENGTISSEIPNIPDVDLHFLNHIPPKSAGRDSFWYVAFGHLNLMVWVLFALVILAHIVMFRTAIGLRLRSVGEHPRAADTVGISVYKTRYWAVILSGILAALGGAYLAVGYTHAFSENMTAFRGFIGLAAVIFGNWRPGGAFAAALLFGFFDGLSTRIQQYGYEPQVLLKALPYMAVLVAVVGLIGRSIPPAAVGRPYVKQ